MYAIRSYYDEVACAIEWPRWFSPKHTIRVNVAAIRSPVKSLDFVTLRVKDAVCDVFRTARGERPHVDTRSPDVVITSYSIHYTKLYDSSVTVLVKFRFSMGTSIKKK